MLENVKKYETFYGITAITVISPLLEFDVFFLFVPFLIRFFSWSSLQVLPAPAIAGRTMTPPDI